MKNQFHILNGDALLQHFPKSIVGERIVARECMVDGPVEGSDLQQLFNARAKFLSGNYGGTVKEYFEKVVTEFEKIRAIEGNSDIHLWFEDDLFCQVNFWFISYLISTGMKDVHVYLVRPKVHTQYGFGGLTESQLVEIFEQKREIKELDKIGHLWNAYQHDDTNELLNISSALANTYPFIEDAVNAHMDRIPTDGNLGRPINTIRSIMRELNTQEFSIVFREFCKREPIYGFGDLQIKRLFDKIIETD